MTEEEKKNFKHIKERAEYVSENILGTNVFTTYDVYCVNMVIEIIQKQDTEINKLNEKISKAIGHIEACKTTLGNYILSPNETECLLNILKGGKKGRI